MLRKSVRALIALAIDTQSTRALWWAGYLNDIRSWLRGADWDELRVQRDRLSRQRKPEADFTVQFGAW